MKSPKTTPESANTGAMPTVVGDVMTDAIAVDQVTPFETNWIAVFATTPAAAMWHQVALVRSEYSQSSLRASLN